MNHRQLKDRLYAAWADTAKALASPKRVELLDLLAQAERTVEALAREAGMPINNTSSHLGVLRASGLVETRKEAQFVFYRLADESVALLLREVQALARRQRHEVDHLARTFIDGGDPMEPVDAAELRRRLSAGEVTLIDVRPALEFEAGHIEGAISVPLATLDDRLSDVRTDRPVVAYCRGPYCVMAVQAVERLRQRGFDARRCVAGVTDWRAAGYAVAVDEASRHGDAVRRPRSSSRRRAS